MNRLRVVETVREHGALTQVEIAQISGLSAATVSNVVRELESSGIVTLSPSVRNGRRAVLVALNAPTGLVAGIVFGDRDVRVAVAADPSQVLAEKRMPLRAEHAADEGVQRSVRLLADIAASTGHQMSEVRAVVVGLPAPLDLISGHIGAAGIMPGWRGVDVAQAVTEMLQTPVQLDNTANLAALGELKAGVLQGVNDAIFLRVSHGVGAALVIAGEIYRGASGSAGEIGHVTVDPNGSICRCGNRGCLETVVGSAAVVASLSMSHGSPTLRDAINLALGGDPDCLRALSDVGRRLGVAVAGVVNLVNPAMVVLGGQLARLGNVVREPLALAVQRCAIPSAAQSASVVCSALGERAEVLGAMALADESRLAADRAALAT